MSPRTKTWALRKDRNKIERVHFLNYTTFHKITETIFLNGHVAHVESEGPAADVHV